MDVNLRWVIDAILLVHHCSATVTRWVIDAILLVHHSSPTVTFSRARQTREVDPMLAGYWASVVDDGPTLNLHWISISYLLRVTSFDM